MQEAAPLVAMAMPARSASVLGGEGGGAAVVPGGAAALCAGADARDRCSSSSAASACVLKRSAISCETSARPGATGSIVRASSRARTAPRTSPA